MSPASAVHDALENPSVSTDLTYIETGDSLVHQTALAASSGAGSQPQVTLNTSLESHLTSIAVQVSPPWRPSSGRGDEPSDSDTTKKPDDEAREPLPGRESPRGGPVQALSVSAALAEEAPGQRSDVPNASQQSAPHAHLERRSTVHIPARGLTPLGGPTNMGTMALRQTATSDGCAGPGSFHGTLLGHLTVEEGVHREERALGAAQIEGRTGRAAAVLLDEDMTAGGQGAEEFELVTRSVCDITGEGSVNLELCG